MRHVARVYPVDTLGRALIPRHDTFCEEVFSERDDTSSMRIREPQVAAFARGVRVVGNCR